MAWKAKVVDKSPNYRAGEVNVTVEFFDDANPLTILHKDTFAFAASFSLQELQAKARQVGAEERRKRQQVDLLLASIPVGAEVVV